MYNNELDQYRALFIEELEDQLQIMDEELMQIEQQGESEECIQNLFRAAHTIKGSSAAMGQDTIKDLTHHMEQVLDGVRSQKLSISTNMIDLLFTCLDGLKELKDQYFEGIEQTMHIDPLVDQLQNIANHSTNDSQVSLTNATEVFEKETTLKRMEIIVSIASSSEMKLARAIVIYNKLLEWGEVLETTPSLDDELEDSVYTNLKFMLVTETNPSKIEEFIGFLLDVESVDVSLMNDKQEANSKSNLIDATEEKSDEGNTNNLVNSTHSQKSKSQTTIRVNVDRLENLMNLVGELVIDQTRIRQVKGNLHRKFHADDDVEELGHVSDHVTRVIADLQDSVMKVRMLPIDQLFNRFPRMIRDLSHSLHKEVELTLSGNETELDRNLIEEIGDPLIHLIRNAIDHGIESPEERATKGKPEKGQLKITAAHENNQIAISVEDDGAGIDPEKMKQSAVQKGMITSDEADKLTNLEAIHLIFHAGFSTAAQVSEVSGRGVGMDIVRNDIERLNGLIDIDSVLGKGTTFKIRLPLTLAIITGLLVNISNRTFILPMGNVAEIVRVSPHEIKMVQGSEVIVNRDRVIPVIWLHDHFNMPRIKQRKNKLPVVIVGTAEKRVAMAVDDLIGNQDIVIKTLGSFIGKTNCISGSTILGDGRVALILEVSDILKHK